MILTVTAPVTKRCPYKDESDDGEVTLTFHVAEGDGPELHDLASLLDTYRHVEISHEAFTREVAAATGAESVCSTWTTAGMTVTARVPS